MRNDTTYARIAPVKGSWQYRDDKGNYLNHVHIVGFLPDWKPNYAMGQHLYVETDKQFYRIYNPQKLRFDFNRFMSGFKTQLRLWDEELISYEVVQE